MAACLSAAVKTVRTCLSNVVKESPTAGVAVGTGADVGDGTGVDVGTGVGVAVGNGVLKTGVGASKPSVSPCVELDSVPGSTPQPAARTTSVTIP